jgi:hypothetical protein
MCDGKHSENFVTQRIRLFGETRLHLRNWLRVDRGIWRWRSESAAARQKMAQSYKMVERASMMAIA